MLLLAAAALGAASAQAQEVRRAGAPDSPISASVELPQWSRLVYVSGTVPDPADADAPPGSVQRFGDTAAQTRSVLSKIEAQLREHDSSMEDVVMMRVFLVAPPGQARMDFAGMMTAYREFFGTEAQPHAAGALDDAGRRPGRSGLAGRDRSDGGDAGAGRAMRANPKPAHPE